MKKNTTVHETPKEKIQRAKKIISILRKEYAVHHTALRYGTPLELLISVILSAQCTDKQVNVVTPELFSHYSTAADFANADVKKLERLIHSTGFYHNKAKNIINCCKKLQEQFAGEVPQTLDELVQLPGVGRKTANVVLGEVFGKIEGIVVDTHVARLSKKIWFTSESDAVKIENDLMKIIPKKDWFQFSHALIFHGRKICSARKPLCAECSINTLCPSSLV